MITSEQRKALLWAYQAALACRDHNASRKRAADKQGHWSPMDRAQFARLAEECEQHAHVLRALLQQETSVIQWREHRRT